MKLHLPVYLFRSVQTCLAAICLTEGSGVARAETNNLTFSGSTLTWDTSVDNKSFTDETDAATSFTAGDNVCFTGVCYVTLGENIDIGTLDIASGAEVTIDLGSYTLNSDTIFLSGTLDVGNSLSIASGSTLAMKTADAKLNSSLALGEKSRLVAEASADLNNNILSLQGSSDLILTAAGDGKTYILFTGISELQDAEGNSLTAGSYSVNDYFDKSAPGSGFWADSTLVYTTDGTLQIVRHDETVKEAAEITERQLEPPDYSYYKSISFNNISASTNVGGAIYGDTISLNNNGSVSFSGNSATAIVSGGTIIDSGGAIYGNSYSDISLSNNGSVSFSGNSTTAGSTSASTSAYGGAIYGDSYSDITLNNNGEVSFSGNSANSYSYTYKGDATASGGAIYAVPGSTVTLNNNGSISFNVNSATASSNTGDASASGGAINRNLNLSNNGSITFSRNYAIANSNKGNASASGGAIYHGITLSNNGSVTFSGNYITAANTTSLSVYATGGAINGNTILKDNGTVNFSGNYATASSNEGSATARGGAIGGGTLRMTNNASVSFTANSIEASTYVTGGAIYNATSTITLSNNGSVSFCENSATASLEASGGAIYNYYARSTLSLDNNEEITFSRNSATVSSNKGDAFAYGGAIYNKGTFYIRNNSSVLFEKNVEISDGNYRLRSIYMDSGSMYLSAAKDGNITFKDSIYIASGSKVELNADYKDADSVVHKQTGDIIFNGADAEKHLNEWLTKNKAGRTATDEEISLSQTSVIESRATLYGGKLRVEEQATLKTSAGLTVADNSNATVQVSNATIDAGDSDISIGKSATLVLCNGAVISAANINMAAGATLMTTALTSNVIQSPAIAAMSLSDAESASSAVFNTPAAGTVDGNLTFEAGSTLVADGAHFNMSENSILTFKAISGGEKINLVLTLGAEYGEDGQVLLFSDADVVKFILDGEEVSGTYTFNANDFFTGAWINNNTKLCYSDKTGLVYVQNVNSVAIPEPTTATLSLLALAALAARRRRTQEK